MPELFHVDTGETSLAVTHWQGAGPPVLMVHATGFHSRCWDQVIRHLPDRHVYAVDLRYHGKSGCEGTPNWHVMTQDIHRLLHTLDLQDILGVGHSLGGHIVTRAAAAAPERFRHLVLIDPVIMPPQHFQSITTLRRNVEPTEHPISRRKNHWRGPDEMYQRFASRKPFSTWDPRVLRDYCQHALQPDQQTGDWQLACAPINEASIYLNHDGGEGIYDELPRLMTPSTLLRAPPREDNAADLSSSPTWPELAHILPNCQEVYLPELNHFIPMQDPALVARYIQAVQ